MDSWHDRPVAEIAAGLEADVARGLTDAEAADRLHRQGPNELQKATPVSALSILADQFKSLVIWVLLVAAFVSIALGELADGIAITAIVVLNAVIGFIQEYRAEKAAAALARLTAPRAKVTRNGRAVVVPTAEVVRGDLLVLEAGDLVAADGRLIEASAMRTAEAALTGESEPVQKQVEQEPADTPLADRRNMVFLGTSVAAGSGRALVVATGMATELGHIARLLESAGSGETPLQRRLDRVARRLLWACLIIVTVVFVLGLIRAVPPFELFLSAVSLAVAAIPEGLPAVVTVALALGVQRMARRNALVRRLPAVETLGNAQVICTDKTGTLTRGEMTVRKVATAETLYQVTGEGYATDGGFVADGVERVAADDAVLQELLEAAAACNDAELGEKAGRPVVVGDPTEGALLVVAAKGGITRETVESNMPRSMTLPFDSDRKRMTVVRQCGGAAQAFVKGAPEVILERCTHIRTRAGCVTLTEALRQKITQAGQLMAADALRVLAVASRTLDPGFVPAGAEAIEQGLTLLGLAGMQDPPRPEAREAIARCRQAGVKTVMITGDHPDTARAIARELGVLQPGDQVIVGGALDRLSDAELAARVAGIAVYARVTAEHKLRIVRAWKSRGSVVAMTGDGVNDAPALREAAIGVAMGITGTEVTKEAADIIVTDDNFASIVAAVEEGRGIYDNIAKTLGYLLAGNAGELTVVFVAALVGWPLPLLPLHLLWINLVTDGLPALALATDPIDHRVMARPPRLPQAGLMDRDFLRGTALTGLLTAAVTLGAFAYELLRSFGARSATQTVWRIGLFSNMRLFAIVAASFWLQITIHHVPWLQSLFDIEPVTLAQCVGWAVIGLMPLLVLELRKLFSGPPAIGDGARPYESSR